MEASGTWAADHSHDQAASGLARADEGGGRCRLKLLLTLRQAREELGRWPTAAEWEFATTPHRRGSTTSRDGILPRSGPTTGRSTTGELSTPTHIECPQKAAPSPTSRPQSYR
jgi:hypothetical protein